MGYALTIGSREFIMVHPRSAPSRVPPGDRAARALEFRSDRDRRLLAGMCRVLDDDLRRNAGTVPSEHFSGHGKYSVVPGAALTGSLNSHDC